MTDSDLDLWYPAAVRDPAPESCWGVHADAGEPKFLLHTTEGGLGVYAPDPRRGEGRTYYGNTGTWPTYTLALHAGRWRVFQHVPSNRAAMSLRNRPGGVQTNRDNVSQVEIAARAVEIAHLPGEAVDELARLLAWEHAVRGVPIVSPAPLIRWVPYPASYGERAPQRLSPAAWDAYSGVCGHQHAPENDHGDPGFFPISSLLSRARYHAGTAAPQPSEDDVTPEQLREIVADVLDERDERIHRQAFAVEVGEDPIRQGNVPRIGSSTYRKVGDIQDVLAQLRDGQARLERGMSAASQAAGAAMALPPRPPSPDQALAAIRATRDPKVLGAYLRAIADQVALLPPPAREDAAMVEEPAS